MFFYQINFQRIVCPRFINKIERVRGRGRRERTRLVAESLLLFAVSSSSSSSSTVHSYIQPACHLYIIIYITYLLQRPLFLFTPHLPAPPGYSLPFQIDWTSPFSHTFLFYLINFYLKIK